MNVVFASTITTKVTKEDPISTHMLMYSVNIPNIAHLTAVSHTTKLNNCFTQVDTKANSVRLTKTRFQKEKMGKQHFASIETFALSFMCNRK